MALQAFKLVRNQYNVHTSYGGFRYIGLMKSWQYSSLNALFTMSPRIDDYASYGLSLSEE